MNLSASSREICTGVSALFVAITGSTVSRPVRKMRATRFTRASYQVPPAIVARAEVPDDRGHLLIHTFLFEEGTWRAEGEYRDASGAKFAVAGETTVRHEASRWLFEAVQRLRGDPARVQHNRYEIAPFSPGARSTHWTSNNPAVGALRGRF